MLSDTQGLIGILGHRRFNALIIKMYVLINLNNTSLVTPCTQTITVEPNGQLRGYSSFEKQDGPIQVARVHTGPLAAHELA